MVKSEKELVIIEVLLSIIFLSNIFIKNIMNNYIIFFILLITIGLITFLMGYEKDQNLDGATRKKLYLYVTLYSVGFIVFQYGLGLFLDFVKSPYKTNLLGIFSNTISMILIIFASEYLRYMIVKKGENKKVIIILAFILFVIIDLTINVKYYNIRKITELIEYLTYILLPSIFKNYVLTRFSYKYGIKQNIIYRLILELYIYIVPFTPDLGIYIESVLLMIFPLMLNTIITIEFEKEKKEDFRESKLKKSLVPIIILLITIPLVYLNSNLFRYWIAAVGSGSMEPTINVGDAIIVDKSYSKHLNKLKKGDILVFTINKKIYTHRIIEIRKDDKIYSINTKGDRKGQAEDNWVVTNDDVIGIVKHRIRYIGYPTVWLSRILEGEHGQ